MGGVRVGSFSSVLVTAEGWGLLVCSLQRSSD